MSSKKAKSFLRIVVIPDTQVKPGVNTDHLSWVGKYILDQRPDVVVHLGDHWDMPSLSSYDKGKACFEGRRYKKDVEAGNEAMRLLTREYRNNIKPREVFLLGNHEERIARVSENDAAFEGVVGYQDLFLKGWEVVPYREPISIGGILFCHYFYNPMNGRPYSGAAGSILRQVGSSFVMGHRQVLDIATHQTPSGGRRRGIIAGACYSHEESYLGPQGNNHWRGILVLNEARGGDFDLMEVSLDYLKRRFGGKR